jgi:hypothetical protein
MAKPSNPHLRTFTCFPRLPLELQRMVWGFALPAPRTITIISTDFTIRDAKGWTVRKYCVAHNAPSVPSLLHACQESRKVALKTYHLTFRPQLRGNPIYFDFQSDTLCLKDENALLSFFGGYSNFDATGMVGDAKEKVCHLAIGGFCGREKTWDELGELEEVKSLILQKPRRGSLTMERKVEALETKWLSRMEQENFDHQAPAEGASTIDVQAEPNRVFKKGLPEIMWFTEAKLRQKSNRERVSRAPPLQQRTS